MGKKIIRDLLTCVADLLQEGGPLGVGGGVVE